jgi:hypothetical protein
VYGFHAALREGLTQIASERGEGAKIALLGGLDPTGDSVSIGAHLASAQPFPQRFEGDILEAVSLKKLGSGVVYLL